MVFELTFEKGLWDAHIWVWWLYCCNDIYFVLFFEFEAIFLSQKKKSFVISLLDDDEFLIRFCCVCWKESSLFSWLLRWICGNQARDESNHKHISLVLGVRPTTNHEKENQFCFFLLFRKNRNDCWSEQYGGGHHHHQQQSSLFPPPTKKKKKYSFDKNNRLTW